MAERSARRRGRVMPAVLTVGLVLSLGLAGCDNSDDEPYDSGLPSEGEQTTPASTSSPTEESPTPTEPSPPVPPSIPDAATKPGPEGARAFVAFYIDLLNYARHTGDVETLQKYSHPECGGCGDYIRFYRKWYARGGWFKDGDRTITSYDRVVRAVPPNDLYIRISGVHKAGTERERRGAQVKRAHRERYTLQFWLVRDSREWRVSGLDNP